MYSLPIASLAIFFNSRRTPAILSHFICALLSVFAETASEAPSMFFSCIRERSGQFAFGKKVEFTVFFCRNSLSIGVFLNSLYLISQQNSNTEYNKHSPLGGSHLKMFSRKAPFKDSFPGITVFRLFLQNYHSEHFESCRHPHPKMQFSTAAARFPPPSV